MEFDGRSKGDVGADLPRLKNLSDKRQLIDDLRRRKSPRAVVLLVELLKDESWYLREQAAQALFEAGPEAVGPVLKLLAEGLWFSRAAAAKVLGRIGEAEAIDPLLDCLMDSNKTVQGAAASALVEIARRSSYEPLAEALSGRPFEARDLAIARLSILDAGLATRITALWETRLSGADEVKPDGEGMSETGARRSEEG